MKSREDRRKCEFSAARARGEGGSSGPWRPPADRKHGWGLGGAARETLQKCVVTHFEARGPRVPLEAWRCAAAGASGALWNRGDAF